jgi:hypothetical protein
MEESLSFREHAYIRLCCPPDHPMFLYSSCFLCFVDHILFPFSSLAFVSACILSKLVTHATMVFYKYTAVNIPRREALGLSEECA